jgi:hypothetical protein
MLHSPLMEKEILKKENSERNTGPEEGGRRF